MISEARSQKVMQLPSSLGHSLWRPELPRGKSSSETPTLCRSLGRLQKTQLPTASITRWREDPPGFLAPNCHVFPAKASDITKQRLSCLLCLFFFSSGLTESVSLKIYRELFETSKFGGNLFHGHSNHNNGPLYTCPDVSFSTSSMTDSVSTLNSKLLPLSAITDPQRSSPHPSGYSFCIAYSRHPSRPALPLPIAELCGVVSPPQNRKMLQGRNGSSFIPYLWGLEEC